MLYAKIDNYHVKYDAHSFEVQYDGAGTSRKSDSGYHSTTPEHEAYLRDQIAKNRAEIGPHEI